MMQKVMSGISGMVRRVAGRLWRKHESSKQEPCSFAHGNCALFQIIRHVQHVVCYGSSKQVVSKCCKARHTFFNKRSLSSLSALVVSVVFLVHGNYVLAGYLADSLTRADARNYVGAKLFGISYGLVNSSSGINAGNNDWGLNVDMLSPCLGYDGGHSGIDIQTKDVAGAATAEREFFSLTKGEVLAATPVRANAIAVYNSSDNKTVIYLHARQVFVSPGMHVDVGTKLGIQGNLGLGMADATANEHVHVEVRAGQTPAAACGASTTLDPLDYLYDSSKGPSTLTFSPASYSELLRNGGQLNITATGWNPAPGTVSLYNGPNVEYVVPRQWYQSNIAVAPSNWTDNVISSSINVNLFNPSSLGNSATPFGAPAIDSNFIYPVNIMVYSGTLPFPLSPLLGQSYYPFRDVKPDNWASCYIMKLWRAGIVNGQNGIFRPTDTISRVEFLKMTMNAAFTPSLFTSTSINSFLPTYFTDNKFEVWQYPYINTALQKNIINDSFCNGSFTSHCFYPNEAITRSDAVTFLVRAFGLKQNGQPTTFSDAPISSYPDVYVAASNFGEGGCGGDLQKIVSGYGDGRFGPKDLITREQASKIIAVALSFKKP